MWRCVEEKLGPWVNLIDHSVRVDTEIPMENKKLNPLGRQFDNVCQFLRCLKYFNCQFHLSVSAQQIYSH